MEGPIHHRGQPARVPASAELVEALLAAAGLADSWAVESVPSVGWVNATTVVRVGGERVVVRRYGWPFEEAERFDRRAKEAWLHPRLAAAGVPAAEVLATAEVGHERGALLSWLPGELLGTVAARVSAAELAGAWREAGAALRAAHEVAVPRVIAGFVTADGVAALPEGSFGAFHRDRLSTYAERLAGAAPGLGIDADRVAFLADRALPVVDATPLVLGHGDSHAWNVLVERGPDGRWGLSGWLDWEFAWVGDPAWDHMRMVVQRFTDFGPVPEPWWDGYGGRPPAANLAVAVLHFMLWKALDHVAGVDSRDAAVALAWLADLPAHLDRLERLLG